MKTSNFEFCQAPLRFPNYECDIPYGFHIGEPGFWYSGKHVCEALGLGKANSVLVRVPTHRKLSVKTPYGNKAAFIDGVAVMLLGYRAQIHNEQAEEFREWALKPGGFVDLNGRSLIEAMSA